MRTDALVALTAICVVLVPAVVYLLLRWKTALRAMPMTTWLGIYAVAAALFAILLPRKHWEAALIRAYPANYLAWLAAQMDNSFWEELGKLLALALFVALSGPLLHELLRSHREATALGYWAGLTYGVGEAITLALLFINPGWSQVFGMNTFMPYLVGWGYVFERFWAIQLHGVMGSLIGIGLYGFYGKGRKVELLIYFVVAMLYHEFVDGMVITLQFLPQLAATIQPFLILLVPVDVAIGYLLLFFAYRWSSRKGEPA
ncbi:MAG: hypothetical protein HY783_00955 [Chloroflexi bacterium]|nr:hypothetical protein [Chloroflexota bacterium]